MARRNKNKQSADIKKAYYEGARGYAKNFENWKNKNIGSSIKRGISAITSHHPGFTKIGKYLSKHIDRKKLYGFAENIYRELRRKNVPEHIRMDYLSDAVSNYIAGGAMFDERGKELILRKGLEGKAQGGFFGGFFARRELEGEAYIDNVVSAFSEMYDKIEEGKVEGVMPDVAEAAKTIKYLGFANEAINVLNEYGLMGKRRLGNLFRTDYSDIKGKIRGRIDEEYNQAVRGLESYISPVKIAASIFGVFGIGLIVASQTGITGNVIGNSTSSFSATAAGIVLLIFGLILFLGRKKF